jgi:hypothetical protein
MSGGGAPALSQGERSRDRDALRDRVGWARVLREDLGLAPDDHAALLIGSRWVGRERQI